MLMPLELKTGRVSNSSEHHGQVLYCQITVNHTTEIVKMLLIVNF